MKSTLAITGSLLAALVADAAGLSRADLEKRLQDLAKAPPPTKLSPGAMCYDMAMPTQRIDYVCPACQEKTLYSNRSGNAWNVPGLMLLEADTYRRLAKQLQDRGLACKLDESAFCQKCGKDIKEKSFVLETRWPGQEKPHRTVLRATNDLKLVLEFLDGKKIHAGEQGAESPLKNYLPRIQELLGLGELPKQPVEKKP